MALKSDVFKSVLNEFETEELRLFCEDLLNKQLDMNMTMPSSTSYKYHNKTQCEPGGQAAHVLMVGTVMNYILGLEYIKTVKFVKPKQRDCLRIAALCHDICKTNGGTYTVHEHPILSGHYVENTPVEHDIDPNLKKYIARLIESHSGQWTTNSRSALILPSVENDEQFFVHLADYLSSRSNIDMIYSDEQMEFIKSFQEPVSVDQLTMPFGKHKGELLINIDLDYLRWCNNNMDALKEPHKSAIKKIIGEE